MEEFSGKHLSPEEFEQLILSATESTSAAPASELGSAGTDSDETARTRALRHVESCDICRSEAASYGSATLKLKQLQTSHEPRQGKSCASVNEWWRFAAGLVGEADGREYLLHAASCDHCGRLLQQASAAFDETFTAEEEHAISQLESSQTSWQEKLARELTIKSQVDQPVKAAAREFPRRISWPHFRFWAYGAAAAAVVAAVLLVVVTTYRTQTPDKLLAKAYAEQRNLELRFSGAQYGPVRIERSANGESRLNRSPSLLEAEALIGRGLQKEPNNPVWLQAKGRADLLDGNYEAAIRSFQKALEIQPDSDSLQTDAASAYFQRGQLADRASDFGKAIELLSGVLTRNPDDAIARFNRALVSERMFLYRQAVSDWEYYLRLDPNGDWAVEANQHLNNLREKLREQEKSATEPRLDPEAFLKRSEEQPESAMSAPGNEDHLDLAIREWLPNSVREEADFAQRSQSNLALSRLALATRNDNHDEWLSELLASAAGKSFSRAIVALSEALHANATGDFGRAQTSALQAQLFFQEDGNVAGQSRAQLEMIYALDRSGEGKRCLLAGDQLAAKVKRFAWIEGQLFLERSNCLSQMGQFSEARQAIERSLTITRNSGYRLLQLRALGIAAALHTDEGNPAAAGSLDRDGLQRCWEGNCPPIRAYQFYSDLGFHAERYEQWHFALALAKEAVSAISLSPQRLGEAFARRRLAKTAVKVQDQELAIAEFDHANEVFATLPQTEVTRTYQADGEIELARLESERGNLEQAATHLATARQQLPTTTRYFTALNFYRTLGELQRLRGDQTKAEQAFRAAVAVTERGLASLGHERNRTVWARETSDFYRTLAHSRWRARDIEGALAVWEWYRSAALRVAKSTARSTQPEPERMDLDSFATFPALPEKFALSEGSDLNKTNVVVYLQMPTEIMIWFADPGGITGKSVSIAQTDLRRLVRRFADECANPNSDLTALQRDARQLYNLLVAPIADLLAAHRVRTLVIQTDQCLADVPLAALLDPAGRYLGESHDIVISEGRLGSRLDTGGPGFAADQKALIVGSPALSGNLAASVEPLADALQEAQYVASKFKTPTLLTGGAATIDKVQQELPRSEIFHFAGHALVSTRQMGLLLAAGDTQADAQDQTTVLDSKSLAQMKLNSIQLAVFSACSTAKDSNSDESGAEGLVNLFLQAGVGQVIASRWNVDSQATTRFMWVFYDALLSDQSVIASVGAAGQQLRAHSETRHPYYWAAFTVFRR